MVKIYETNDKDYREIKLWHINGEQSGQAAKDLSHFPIYTISHNDRVELGPTHVRIVHKDGSDIKFRNGYYILEPMQ